MWHQPIQNKQLFRVSGGMSPWMEEIIYRKLSVIKDMRRWSERKAPSKQRFSISKPTYQSYLKCCWLSVRLGKFFLCCTSQCFRFPFQSNITASPPPHFLSSSSYLQPAGRGLQSLHRLLVVCSSLSTCPLLCGLQRPGRASPLLWCLFISSPPHFPSPPPPPGSAGHVTEMW